MAWRGGGRPPCCGGSPPSADFGRHSRNLYWGRMVAAAQLAAEAWRSNACRTSRPDKGSSWAAWVCFEPSLWRSSAETRLACLARTRAETWRCASECAALAVSQLLCFSVSSQSTAIKKRRKLKTTEIEKALTQKRGRVGLSEKETKDKKKKEQVRF